SRQPERPYVWYNVWHAEDNCVPARRAQGGARASGPRAPPKRSRPDQRGRFSDHREAFLSRAADSLVFERSARSRATCGRIARGIRRGLILLDTSAVLAVVDDSELDHAACAAALRASSPPRTLS